MSWILKMFYKIYLPIFAPKNSVVYVDPYRKWYALYFSDTKKWTFKTGDYLWNDTKVKIDNSAYGQLKSCLGAFNLDRMKPVLDEALRDEAKRLLNDLMFGKLIIPTEMRDQKVIQAFIRDYAKGNGIELQ